MRKQHQEFLIGKQFPEVFEMIMAASIEWNISDYTLVHNEVFSAGNITNRKRRTLNKPTKPDSVRHPDNNFIHDDAAIDESHHSKGQSIQEEIAHAFHFASISILGLILLEVRILFVKFIYSILHLYNANTNILKIYVL